MTEYDVVVPAGGTIDSDFARLIGTPWRALAPLGPARTPVLQVVVDALRASGCVRRIVCVAPQHISAEIVGADTWLDATPQGTDNILRGLSAANDGDAPVLVCTSDLPLIMPADIADFCARCEPSADITLGLVRADGYNNAFIGAPPSAFVPLRDIGPVTISGLFCVRPALLLDNRALLARIFEARKSQWGMVSLLGPRLVGQFLTRRLTLDALTSRTERLLHCRAQTLLDIAPALACDMDTADDYTYAHQNYTARLVS